MLKTQIENFGADKQLNSLIASQNYLAQYNQLLAAQTMSSTLMAMTTPYVHDRVEPTAFEIANQKKLEAERAKQAEAERLAAAQRQRDEAKKANSARQEEEARRQAARRAEEARTTSYTEDETDEDDDGAAEWTAGYMRVLNMNQQMLNQQMQQWGTMSSGAQPMAPMQQRGYGDTACPQGDNRPVCFKRY